MEGDDVAQGALMPLLEGKVGQVLPVSMVYAAGSKLSPKIRCFVDYASAWVERLTKPLAPGVAPLLTDSTGADVDATDA